MLDRSKVIQVLQQASIDLFVGFVQEIDIARHVWSNISQDDAFQKKIHAVQQSLLIPTWQGLLAPCTTITPADYPYTVIAVDGSQIYYDKHQGPPCFLINIGFMQLTYGMTGKACNYGSFPFLTTRLDQDNDFGSQDYINMLREKYEFEYALQYMSAAADQHPDAVSVCLFDGSLIFFHLDAQDMERKEEFLAHYCHILEQLYQKKMLVAGYMSLPRTKELVNLCKLELAQFDEHALEHTAIIDRLTDVDITQLYVKPYQRSIVFKSKAPICYLYPPHLQPYFCYLHVGSEVVRLEFPAWIAQDTHLVDIICSVALDQAMKGRGYPVCLFEAHEQAVVKSIDRDFFYTMLEKLSNRQAKNYGISQKSIKKQKPIV